MNAKQEVALKAILDIIGGDPLKDSFRVKVGWRASPNEYPETWAIFDKVTSEQLSMPEPWLTAVAGSAGGIYDIDIFEQRETRKKVSDGFVISMNLDRAPKTRPDFNWAALSVKGYAGPVHVTHPVKPEKVDEGIKVSTTAPLPAPPRIAPLLSNLGGGSDRSDDLQRRETELLVREAEARLRSELTARAPVTEKEKPLSQFGELIPLAMQLLKDNNDNRRADAAAAREERRDALERDRQAREAADKRTEALLIALKPVPVTKDPMMEVLLTKLLNRDDTATLKAQGEALAQTTNTVLQFMHTKAEIDNLNAPAVDSPFMQLFGKGLDALVAMNVNAQGGIDPAAPAVDAPAQLGEPAVEDEETPLMRLEKAVRKMSPGDVVANLFCQCLQDSEFQVLRSQYKGWEDFIVARFGPWISKNAAQRGAYVQDLIINHCLPEAKRRGLIGPMRPVPAAAAAPGAPAPVAPKKGNGAKLKANEQKEPEAPVVETKEPKAEA